MFSNKSVNVHQFAMIPKADIPRSRFKREYTHKTTIDSGYLIPVYVDEVLPGDTFNLSMTAFARMATPIFPIMDNMYLDSFFFFVPNRLVWTNWQKFMGQQDNPGDSTSFSIPQQTSPASGYAVGSLQDYMGLPTVGQVGVGNQISHSALPVRAYNLIWNEWFRDQNLQDSVTVDTGDGPDAIANYVLLKRGKRHDYFTSCLPWTSKNNTGTAVSVGLAGSAPVLGIATNKTVMPFTTDLSADFNDYNGEAPGSNWSTPAASTHFSIAGQAGANPVPRVYADLSVASGITINSLRLAFQTQKMYERDARGGTRYREIVQSHFGVLDPNDSRLQRPEYLGGGTSPIMLTPVPQTSVTSGSSATGRLSAAGIHAQKGQGFVKSFSEHCLIIGLVCVYADLTYQCGLDRMFSRSTRLDMYWPALANIGEQSVLNKEIYAQGSANAAQDAAVFGYQERYAEYRYKPSHITGKMRSHYATPLDYWHLSQKFTGLPTLGSTFIQETPPVDRVVAVNTEPQFFFDAYFDLKCARPMPTYSVPGLIDHF